MSFKERIKGQMTNKTDVEKIVKDWYAKTADYEWKRLVQDPYHQIEFIVTSHFLNKHLPRSGLILDAGGGPGRYTIALAKKGYNVVLLDLVKETLEIAKEQIKREKVEDKVKQIVEGSIKDLSMFPDETFDGVLCLGGPLSHFLSVQERDAATSELVRVAKVNAPIFASVIGRLGVLKTILIEAPEIMKHAKHHLEVGDYIPGETGKEFTAAHWFLPEELKELFEKHNVKTLEMAGLEGLSSHLEKATNELYKDKGKWKTWIDIVLKTCNRPSVVGTAEHILYVGRKTGKET